MPVRRVTGLLPAIGAQRPPSLRTVHHHSLSGGVIDGGEARSDGSVEGHLAAIQNQVHALAALGIRAVGHLRLPECLGDDDAHLLQQALCKRWPCLSSIGFSDNPGPLIRGPTRISVHVRTSCQHGRPRGSAASCPMGSALSACSRLILADDSSAGAEISRSFRCGGSVTAKLEQLDSEGALVGPKRRFEGPHCRPGPTRAGIILCAAQCPRRIFLRIIRLSAIRARRAYGATSRGLATARPPGAPIAGAVRARSRRTAGARPAELLHELDGTGSPRRSVPLQRPPTAIPAPSRGVPTPLVAIIKPQGGSLLLMAEKGSAARASGLEAALERPRRAGGFLIEAPRGNRPQAAGTAVGGTASGFSGAVVPCTGPGRGSRTASAGRGAGRAAAGSGRSTETTRPLSGSRMRICAMHAPSGGTTRVCRSR